MKKTTFIAASLYALSLNSFAQDKKQASAASLQPVMKSCVAKAEAGANNINCLAYKVPTGKRLVLESISYSIYTGQGTSLIAIFVGKDDDDMTNSNVGSMVHAIAPIQVTAGVTGNNYLGMHQLRMYFDEGDAIVVKARATAEMRSSAEFAISGHLVDKQ